MIDTVVRRAQRNVKHSSSGEIGGKVNPTGAQLAEGHWLLARGLQSRKHPRLLGSASVIDQIVASFAWGQGGDRRLKISAP